VVVESVRPWGGGQEQRTDELTFECRGKVYRGVVYTPPLVRQTARMRCHCRYWVSEDNAPYTSTDASTGESAGIWAVEVLRTDAAILQQPGSRGEGTAMG